jgi:imidazole glycerol phosphate synthase subunit HisF
MINLVAQNIAIPLIVGGGIVDLQEYKMLMMQALIW